MLSSIHETVGYGPGRGQHRGSQVRSAYSDSTNDEGEQVEVVEEAGHMITTQDGDRNQETVLRVLASWDSPVVVN
ncbi:hypothetical protein G6F55_013239 [Rhizopus delemar]|uniref:Uncharacterized protein n=2 Tax=Rhizopus TaxID=4842 RepID=A0A9P6YAZ2_9FUNG|nr:hypothetical protein G6F55_013239 [Rhizopus delemar]KAG1531470.1 hypothetical protein G6F51_013510 [Rhizopus arrhizus]KAG1486629.1 hypothetical protein G6F54_013211 [Rhizopus delemar]KAG1489664.1 hypothetical protein G6F52_013704 [Rhizopus delemar]KAG1490390.1 hypothetical protein G6F53_013261 [Rhizopus delemar]